MSSFPKTYTSLYRKIQPARRHPALLGRASADRVDRRCALFDEEVAGTDHEPCGLLLFTQPAIGRFLSERLLARRRRLVGFRSTTHSDARRPILAHAFTWS